MPAIPPLRLPRAARRCTLVVGLFALIAAGLSQTFGNSAHARAGGAAVLRTGAPDTEFLDTRRPLTTARLSTVSTVRARAALARSLGPMGVFQLDPRTGTPRIVARLDGYLTGPTTRPVRRVVMGYVRTNRAAFGLTRRDLRTFVFVRDAVDIDGTHHLAWGQEVRGVRAFDNGLMASVTQDGRLVNVLGSPAHGLATSAVAAGVRLSAPQALTAARVDAGGSPVIRPGDRASLVLFYGGRTRLSWETTTRVSPSETDVSVVDAATGRILWRANLTHAAEETGSGLAWESYPSTQVPNGGGAQQPVTFPVRNANRLAGNSAHVYTDTHDDGGSSPADEIPAVSGLSWVATAELDTTTETQNCGPAHACTWDRSTAKSWRANLRQSAVQSYYYVTRYHDHLEAAPIGFTEAAGNFQARNDSRKGRGHDAVRVQVFDGASTDNGLPDRDHYNNANMYVPPDGRAPVMQLYLFQKAPYAPGWVSGNAGDDASIVYHEYTHGLTSRLVTYPRGLAALNSWQSAAMGEAWSDWYAMDLLEAEGHETDTAAVGDVKVGRYITGGKGIRTQPLDCVPSAGAGACPAGASSGGGGYTFGDFTHIARGPEVHADGEIWGQTLWQLRRTLVAQLGRDEGIRTARRLVTRGLQLSPPDPTFLDQRNAILQADTVAYASDHHDLLWTIFAKRGMGYFASTLGGNDLRPAESFVTLPSCADGGCGRIHGRITNALTGKPIGGVLVGLGGHLSGFPGTDLVTTTKADGRFEIRKVPFHTYTDVVIDRSGYEPVVLHGFRVDGDERLRRGVVRDWAAIDGGGRLVKFTPPNYTSFGCGPRGAIDRSLGAGWGSDAPRSRVGSNVTGPRAIVVELSRTIDVTAFAVDPAATCGDYWGAGVKAFDIYTRTANGSWRLAASVSGGLPQGRLNRVVPGVKPDRVRFVKLVMRSNHGDPNFMDLTELSVRGRPS